MNNIDWLESGWRNERSTDQKVNKMTDTMEYKLLVNEMERSLIELESVKDQLGEEGWAIVITFAEKLLVLGGAK